jgi:putative membrane protein
MFDPTLLPPVNALLNSLAGVLLLCGYAAIRRGRRDVHRRFMLGAFGASALFLASYLTYHYSRPPTPFPGHGAARWVYYAILGTHVVLAVAVVPLALTLLYRAWRGDFARHKRLARWTLPIWLYVSVTGVTVYVLLYQVRWG